MSDTNLELPGPIQFTPLPDARPEHLHDPAIVNTHVTVEATRELVTIELNEIRLLVYRHQNGSGAKPYLVIDVDSDIDNDGVEGGVPLAIYRNDGLIYNEGEAVT